MDEKFADILRANQRYAATFDMADLAAPAAKGLGVLTCIDSRIEPLAMLGLAPGDAKIFRNAGARATDDAIRSLVLASNLLDVRRIMVVAHTNCALAGTTDEELRDELARRLPGADIASFRAHAAADQLRTLHTDVDRIRGCGLLPEGTIVGGFVYDVRDGTLRRVVD